MNEPNWDELINKFGDAAYTIPISDALVWRPKLNAARAALRDAIAKVEQERDNLHTTLVMSHIKPDDNMDIDGSVVRSRTKLKAENEIHKLEADLRAANLELAHYRSFVVLHPWMEYRARVNGGG